MDAHLSDDGAFAQRILVDIRSDTGRAQAAAPEFPDDDLGIDLGADDRNFRILDAKFAKDLPGDRNHPVEIAVAAGHAATAENDGTTDPCTGFDHVAEIQLDRFGLEILGAGAEIVRTGVHRAAVADDGVDLALQSRVEQLLGITVAKRATGRDHTVNKLWHLPAPSLLGHREWFAASAGRQMIQTGIENKYGLDIEVSAADMADQSVKRS